MPLGTSADAGEVDDARSIVPAATVLQVAAETARASEQRSRPARRSRLRLLEAAVSELSDIVIVTDALSLDEPGPRIVFVNAAFERRLGYTADEAIGRSPRFLQGPATQREPLERIRRALAARQPIREELVNYTKAGDIIHLELEIVPLFDDDGQCTHFVSIERNISERRSAEASLRLSEERFRLVSRATNDAVWDWDIASDVVWWGDGFDELFGEGGKGGKFLADQWVGRIHDADRDGVLATLNEALTRGDPAWHAEYRFRHTNGEYLWVSGRGYILRDEQQAAYRMIGAMTDITDRRTAEEQLSLLAAALDSVASPVVIMRLNASIRWVNRAFCEMTGYSWDEAVGQHVASLLLPPSAAAISYSELWQQLLQGDSWSGELTNERKDGTEYPSHITIAPVRGPNGNICHFVGLARDLTETQLHEAHLLRTQRIENLGMLAGGIAHDLNNVLSPILMSVDYLRATETDPEHMEALEQMEASARRGAALLRRLLLFARGLDGNHVPLSVREYVKEVADIAQRTFPRTVTVKAQIDVADDELHADPTQLHQVLMNLCVNARDAMPNGGTLTLCATCVTVDEVFAQMYASAVPGRYVMIRVSDTGSGMPPDVQAKLFDPFFTTKPVGEGTGLGLPTVIAIVKGHGGFMRVESEVGKGSAFTLFFPAVAASNRTGAEAEARPSPARGNGELVLVVDDEPSIREMAQRTLEQFGYRVLTAEHGAAAVAHYARHGQQIAVVLVDMVMPILDGAATIAALKSLDPNVRIIASSGGSLSNYVNEATNAGVHYFAHKPYAGHELLQVISDCLQQPAAV